MHHDVERMCRIRIIRNKMQQKKYSFNYLIFKHDFIKRRMLVNPATHPVGVSVSEQTLPQCDQQVDNAVPGFTQKL